MRISDWSSDVYSSDLRPWRSLRRQRGGRRWRRRSQGPKECGRESPSEPLRAHGLGSYGTSLMTRRMFRRVRFCAFHCAVIENNKGTRSTRNPRSEEHTSELQSLMRISYAVFCLKKKKIKNKKQQH